MRRRRWLLAVLALGVAVALSGCARGGETIAGAPTSVLDVGAVFNGTINDTEYYYFAFATNPGIGGPGPVPIANGPYRGNGWGTGPINLFVQYHQGAYTVYRANTSATLAPGGTSGITAVSGTPTNPDVGEHTITVLSVSGSPATATVSDVFFNALTQVTSPATIATLLANSSTPTASPPIPGVTIAAADLVVGGVSKVELVSAGSLTALGVTLDKNLPTGTNQMRFTLDMGTFGGATTLAMNIITTDTINLNSASPEHSYDGLGRLGNNRVILSTNDFRTFTDNDLFQTFDPETTGDLTLLPTQDVNLRNAIDIASWSLTLRRL
jgi:hypothetical protein